MEIEHCPKDYMKFFNLFDGDVFSVDKDIYMKIHVMETVDYDDVYVNAINLRTTKQIRFYEGDYVKKLDAKLVIN